MNTAFITINYEEGFRSIKPEIRHDRASVTIPSKGDFVKDWFNLMDHAIHHYDRISFSSSVDHFLMDGAPFRIQSFFIDGDTPILLDHEAAGHIPFFTPADREPMTWEELKSYCSK